MSEGKFRLKPTLYHIRWMLFIYDLLILAGVCFLFFFMLRSSWKLTELEVLWQSLLIAVCVSVSRFLCSVYRQVWRYGGIQSYIRLIVSDAIAFVVYFPIQRFVPLFKNLSGVIALLIFCINLLGALTIRMVYRYAYKCGTRPGLTGKILRFLLLIFAGKNVHPDPGYETRKIKVAIIGAGRVGTGLAEELLGNSKSAYVPCVFFDVSHEKVGKMIYGIPVLSEKAVNEEVLRSHGVQEVIFALPNSEHEDKKALYERYTSLGCRVKVYDFPDIQQNFGKKRRLREFDPEELLFRKPMVILDEKTQSYYTGKRILITGGGGSIGSELCRQIAKMKPECLIILDICENGAYDIQQELKIRYGNELNCFVEIVSICNKTGLERVFSQYRPHLVLNAAAHKHVPLMEHNCIEAVENNVFGTLNTIELSMQYEAERFIMVSTDKAVNPTNIMGATKRMCEMIAQAYSQSGTKTTFSMTRFGNVLGSAGSVIPLFKKQIAQGGPLTITDKRIIRYFMTIPEATQLVLISGAIAKNGELFVLDMGNPIRILDLAENMIRLSGMVPYKDIDIIETGLRPGEKLYEELLVKTEELDKTDNQLIYVERDTPPSVGEIQTKLDILRKAVATNDDEAVREAMRTVVPTYKKPEDINATAMKSQEMSDSAK